MAADAAMRQLAFPFSGAPAMDEASFFVSDCNREAHGWIMRWPRWLSYGLILHGPSGSGKTHLAHIWRQHADALMLTPQQLEHGMPQSVVERAQNMVLEEADRIRSPDTLFHLLNWAREQRVFLLLTSTQPAGNWPYTLPDLCSRVAALPTSALNPPDDSLLAALLTKLFADRQLIASAPVLEWLVTHLERSFISASQAVEKLDAAALAEGRALTLPLLRRVLAP